METTTWMLEEVQKQVNQERWDGASWCRRQTTRQLEKSAWVLEKLFMEEEGSDKLGKKNYGVIREGRFYLSTYTYNGRLYRARMLLLFTM